MMVLLMRSRRWGVWWGQWDPSLAIVKGARKQSTTRIFIFLLLPWGGVISEAQVPLVKSRARACVHVCIFFLKHVRRCAHLNNKWKLEKPRNKKPSRIYQPSNLSSVHIWSYLLSLLPFLLSPLLLRALLWQQQGALRSTSPVSLPWTMVFAAEIANQPLRSAK